MTPGRVLQRHWLAALLIALVVHGLAGWLLSRQAPEPITSSAGAGLHISLASATAGAPGGASPASAATPRPHRHRESRDSRHDKRPPPLSAPPVHQKLETQAETTPEPSPQPRPEPELEPEPQIEPEAESPAVPPKARPSVTENENTDAVDSASQRTGRAQTADAVQPAAGAGNTTDNAVSDALGGAAAAGVGVQGTASDNALENYAGALQAWLERHKQYPRLARSRRIEGVALVQFSVDSAGRVLSFTLKRSAGNPLLDRAVVAMLERAQPLPAIPTQLNRQQLTVVIPVEFSLRQ